MPAEVGNGSFWSGMVDYMKRVRTALKASWTRSRTAGRHRASRTARDAAWGGRSGGHPTACGEGDGGSVSASGGVPGDVAPVPSATPSIAHVVGIWILRLLAALAIPIAGFFVLTASFDYLRDREREPRAGRPAGHRDRCRRRVRPVLGDEQGRGPALRALPRRCATVGLRRARAGHPERLPALPRDQHDPAELEGQGGAELHRARQLQLRLHRREHAAVDAEHRRVGRSWSPSWG